MINIDELTIKQVKELSTMINSGQQPDNHPYQIGENYFIRTVTMIQIGKLIKVTPQELILENAVWIGNTGRFTQALEDGILDEVELFPKGEIIVGRNAVIDACIWLHDVPTEQK